MTPPHPPWSQRPVMVDSEYCVLDAILRDNVTLVTDGIRRINKTGIETNDGTQYDVDVIVYATGFHANEYLFPMKITGRDGRTLEDVLGGWRRPRLPLLHDPGLPEPLVGLRPEHQRRAGSRLLPRARDVYALQCMERLILEDKKSIDAKEDAYWRYNKEVDERNGRKVWSDPRAHNYYWTDHGRSAVMCPFDAPKIYRLLRYPNFDEMEIR